MRALAGKLPSSGRSGPTPQAGFPPLPEGEGEEAPPRRQLNAKTRQSSAQRLRRARAACDPAIALYDDVALLLEWLGHDILSLAGPAYAQRCLLDDFVTAEFLARVALCPHRLEPVHRTLKNGRQEFLSEARGRSVLLPEKTRI